MKMVKSDSLHGSKQTPPLQLARQEPIMKYNKENELTYMRRALTVTIA